MANWALVVLADPPLAFYRGDRPAGVDLAWPRLVSVGAISATLRTGAAGQLNTSVSATLDGGDAALVAEWSDPPLRAPVRVLRDGEEVWRGLLTRVQIGTTITLDAEG